MYIKREIESSIVEQLNSSSHDIILLSGARQTGKTTIVEQIALRYPSLLLNFWDESPEIIALKKASSFELFEKYLFQFFGFTPNSGTLLIIDEAQASHTLGLFIMEIHRKWKNQKIILLGSILSNLFSENVPMPVGRVVELVCRPLSFREFLRFRKKEGYLGLVTFESDGSGKFDENIHNILMEEYGIFMQYGGLPGIVNAFNDGENIPLIFESLLNNLYRDADRFISSTNSLRRRSVQYGSLVGHVMKTIGERVAFPTTNSSLLSTDSPNYRTILPEVVESLVSWHLIYVLATETKQKTSKKGYNSKKYLYDTGVMNFLINHLFPISIKTTSPFVAQLFENSVMQNLISDVKTIHNIFPYKTNNKVRNELDFVAVYGDRLLPIEVKLSATINQKSITQLLSFLNESKLSEGIVMYAGFPQIKQINGCKLYYLPPYFLSLLPSFLL
ncbi:ATP-binding protein [bacterium]|nr:ATP-binding protein [bacterium]